MTNFSFQSQTLHLLYLLLLSEASKWTNNNKQNHFWVEGGLILSLHQTIKKGTLCDVFVFLPLHVVTQQCYKTIAQRENMFVQVMRL